MKAIEKIAIALGIIGAAIAGAFLAFWYLGKGTPIEGEIEGETTITVEPIR